MSFIVIEGLDGSGKGTQTELLIKYLKEKNISFEFIKSPDYRTPVGEVYKRYLDEEVEMEADAVFLLLACDVMMNKSRIEAARKEGKIIIAERYITATIAFQCANGFPFEKAVKFVELMEYPKPDLIVFIDVEPETGMKRKLEQGKLDRHEKNLEFLRRVREFYSKEIEENVLGKWVTVDGEKSIEEVHEEILKVVETYLNYRGGEA
jgi:dTMP kinase